MHDDNNLYLCIEKFTDFAEHANLIDREVEYLFIESKSCKRSHSFRFQFIKSLFEKNIYNASISQFSVENPESKLKKSNICVSHMLLELCYGALSISIDEFKLSYDLSIDLLTQCPYFWKVFVEDDGSDYCRRLKCKFTTVRIHRYLSIALDEYFKQKPLLGEEKMSVYEFNKKRGFYKDLHPDAISRLLLCY